MAIPIPGVSDGELIRTTWGDAVADAINDECLKWDGSRAMATTARLTLGNVDPTADNHAVRKKYADDNFASTTGDVFTGAVTINAGGTQQVLVLRSQQTGTGSDCVDTPYIRFQTHAATSLGLLQATVNAVNLTCDTGNVNITAGGSGDINLISGDDIVLNSGSNVNITAGGSGDITLNSGGGQVRTTDALYTTGGTNRFFGSACQLIGNVGSTHLDFYPNGSSVDSIGARGGFVGYTGDGHLHLENEGNTTSLFLTTGNAIVFQIGATPVEVARIDDARMLLGKNVSGIATEGIELSGADGQILGTVTTNVSNVTLNRTGSADVDNGVWIRFENNGGTVGTINWDTATSKVIYAQTSDYRLKTIVGPVTDGLDRVRQLQPYRITRKDSPAPIEHDALIAHEVADVMPSVVSGAKDAVAPAPPAGEPPENYPVEGSIVPQTLDYTGLITVSIAAIKDLADQVDDLTARLAALEAA